MSPQKAKLIELRRRQYELKQRALHRFTVLAHAGVPDDRLKHEARLDQ